MVRHSLWERDYGGSIPLYSTSGGAWQRQGSVRSGKARLGAAGLTQG